MNKISVTQLQIDSLELQTNHLFEAFQQAVSTRDIADGEYAHDIHRSSNKRLAYITNTPINEIKREQTSPFDKYCLLLSITDYPIYLLSRGTKMHRSNTHGITIGDIKAQIDNLNNNYPLINSISITLSNDGRYEDILSLVEHVRETHPKPVIAAE